MRPSRPNGRPAKFDSQESGVVTANYRQFRRADSTIAPHKEGGKYIKAGSTSHLTPTRITPPSHYDYYHSAVSSANMPIGFIAKEKGTMVSKRCFSHGSSGG